MPNSWQRQNLSGMITPMEAPHESQHLPNLTKDLLDSIIFAMEDQVSDYYLDVQEIQLISEEEYRYLLQDDASAGEGERFVPIPDWEPSDGFHLMETFANRVRNPLYRQRLLDALQSGKGVFRKFKDVLSEIPVLERKWFSFKDEQLKREVITWYREQEGVLSLQELPQEHEESTDDILLEDFYLESYEGILSQEMETLLEQLLEEMEAGSEQSKLAALLFEHRLEGESLDHFQLARTQEGALVALLAYVPLTDSVVEVPFFGVAQEYRALGLFRLLFDSFCRQMARFHYQKIIITLGGDAVALKRLYSPYSVSTITVQLGLDTQLWNANHPSSEEAYL